MRGRSSTGGGWFQQETDGEARPRRGELVREAIVDASFDQGVGRFRVHRRDAGNPLLIDVVTSHPSRDVAVDALLSVRSLKRDLDDADLMLGAVGLGVGKYGRHIVAALASGRVHERYLELAKAHVKGKKDKNLSKINDKDKLKLVDQALKLAHNAAKVYAKRQKAEKGTSSIKPLFSNNRGCTLFSIETEHWVQRGAPAESATSPISATLHVGSARPIRITIGKYDGETDEETRQRLLHVFGAARYDMDTEPLPCVRIE